MLRLHNMKAMSNFLIFHIKCDLIHKNLLFPCQLPKYSHVTCQFTVTLNKYGIVRSSYSSDKAVSLQPAGRGLLSASPPTTQLVRASHSSMAVSTTGRNRTVQLELTENSQLSGHTRNGSRNCGSFPIKEA